MTKAQRIVLLLACLSIGLTLWHCPWSMDIKAAYVGEIRAYGAESLLKYAPIWEPPRTLGLVQADVRVEFKQLLIQWVGIIVVTVGLLFALKPSTTLKSESHTAKFEDRSATPS